MSHLLDLYRRGRRKNHQREDFASTALAWLIQTDQQACRLLLEELGVEAPAELGRRVVHTQVKLRDSQKRPDLVIRALTSTGTWSPYIECKLDLSVTDAVAGQVRTYKRLTGGPVALLCRESELPSSDDARWSDLPYRGSWEGFVRRLRAANSQLDADRVSPLRSEFERLAVAFRFAPAVRITDAQVRRAMSAQVRLGAGNEALRLGIEAMLPKGTGNAWSWEVEGPLAGSFGRDRAPQGFGLSGLGLTGAHERVGDLPAVTWHVEVYPSTSLRKDCADRVLSAEWEETAYGWWRRALSTAFDPDALPGDILTTALQEARDAVSGDLGVTLPPPGEVAGTELPASLAAVSHDLVVAEDVAQALSGTAARLKGRIRDALQRSVHPGTRLSERGPRKVFLPAKQGHDRQISTWYILESGRAVIGIWCWLGGRKVQDGLEAAFKDLGAADGRSAGRAAGGGVLHVYVEVSPVESLEQRLDEVVADLAGWLAQHAERIGIEGRT